MNLSPAYLEWEQKTLQKGRQEGRQEGELQGRQTAEREMLLQLLTHRFGSLSNEVVQQIQLVTNSQKLKQLATLVIDAPDLESFLQNL